MAREAAVAVLVAALAGTLAWTRASTAGEPAAAPRVDQSHAAVTVFAIDAAGRQVDLERSHASLQRVPPRRPDPQRLQSVMGPSHRGPSMPSDGDPDALRYLFAARPDELPRAVLLRSIGAEGVTLAELRDVPTVPSACPAAVRDSLRCVTTAPLRVVGEVVDANHPLVARRSVVGELGGSVVIIDGVDGVDGVDGKPRELARIRVGGPRRTKAGQIGRLRARLRLMLVRLARGGAPPVGADDAEALTVARAAVARANAIWGACGVSFGPPAQAAIELLAPPPSHLLVLGCDHGLPASGGRVRFRAAGQGFDLSLPRGTTPREAARRIAAVLGRSRMTVSISDNPPGGAAALGSTDLSVRRADGQLVRLEAPRSGPITTDATLGVCIGQVNLDDGLEHFGDVDAVVGTVEERALIKAFDDGDPTTIEVYVVPGFGRGGRIGESFIRSDGGAIRNTVLVDAVGLLASRASYALAHELGHVLLDDPGHTDDYGADTPTRLMDADAIAGGAFGPTRLTLDECAEVVWRSGPDSPVPLLERWPLKR